MFTALLSFLGGNVFRMVFGSISSYFQKKQDNAHELEMMAKQAELEDARSKRQMEAAAQQAQLNIKLIEVQGEQDVQRIETQGWANAVADALKPTGNVIVDIWNGVIRPLAATICIVLWVLALNKAGWTMTDWDKELVAVIFGFYFADRSMRKQGK